MNPLRDCHLRTHQTLRENTKIFARAYYLRPKMHPTWPSEELCATLVQRVRDPLSLLHSSPGRDWLWQSRFVPTISTRAEEAGAMGGSCQFHRHLALLAARRGEPFTNLLAGLDAPFTSAPSRQIPSPRSSWTTVHTGPGTESPQNKELSDQWKIPTPEVTVTLNPLGRRSLLLPSDAWRQESPGIGFHLPWVHIPRWVGSQNLVLRFPQFLHAPTQNSKNLEKNTNSCDP